MRPGRRSKNFHLADFRKQDYFFWSYAYIRLYMHETLPTSANQKERYQNNFYQKSSSKLNFSQATKNLKMFYFTHPAGRVFQK